MPNYDNINDTIDKNVCNVPIKIVLLDLPLK